MAARAILFLAALLPASALATLDDAVPDATYRGLCQMTEACLDNGACGAVPALGDLLLTIDAGGTRMGRREADLAPVDHLPTLADALPLPRIEDARRTFLTDLPTDDAYARRFAVHVQTRHPETGAPALRPQYFVLTCQEAPA